MEIDDKLKLDLSGHFTLEIQIKTKSDETSEII